MPVMSDVELGVYVRGARKEDASSQVKVRARALRCERRDAQ